MRNLGVFIVLFGIVMILNTSAQAVPVADQISAAIASNDYKLVQSLVKDNPSVVGHAEDSLLMNVYNNIVNQPQGAARAMATASTIAPGITPKDAKSVAENVKKIVKLIADKALFVCNPEANANTSQVQAPGDGKKLEDQKAIGSILASAEDIAKTPAIVAVEPQLFAAIEAQRSECATDEDALLAQLPGHQPQRLPPHIVPPPTPASPD